MQIPQADPNFFLKHPSFSGMILGLLLQLLLIPEVVLREEEEEEERGLKPIHLLSLLAVWMVDIRVKGDPYNLLYRESFSLLEKKD